MFVAYCSLVAGGYCVMCVVCGFRVWFVFCLLVSVVCSCSFFVAGRWSMLVACCCGMICAVRRWSLFVVCCRLSRGVYC